MNQPGGPGTALDNFHNPVTESRAARGQYCGDVKKCLGGILDHSQHPKSPKSKPASWTLTRTKDGIVQDSLQGVRDIISKY